MLEVISQRYRAHTAKAAQPAEREPIPSGQLTGYERLLLRTASCYVALYPEVAFRFILDDRVQERLGHSERLITVHIRNSPATCRRIFTRGSLELGRCYCEGLIRAADAEYHEFLLMLARAVFDPRLGHALDLVDRLRLLGAGYRGGFYTHGAQDENINAHYSLSDWFADDESANRFYMAWLGSPYVQYSCGLWTPETTTLEQAQRNKFELYLRRLGVDESWRGRRIVELGCGWGGFLFYAAERFGTRMTGYTLSTAQGKYIAEEARRRGLEDLVQVQVMNVHEFEGTFDAAVSIGLLEHIDDYEGLFARVAHHLPSDGTALFHAMFHEGLVYKADPWLVRYIFPGGHVPSIHRVLKSLRRHFRYVARQDLPAMSYPRTLACWQETFCRREPEIRSLLATSRCGEVDYAVRLFKHYLALARAGMMVNGLVCHVLARGPA